MADWIERFVVDCNFDGWRLDRFLTAKAKRASRSKMGKVIRHGVYVDGVKTTRPARKVREGMIVEIHRTERSDPATPDLDSVHVLFERDELLIINKPPGMLVHRTGHEVSRTVHRYLEERYPDLRAEPTHRIDRDTSGALVCGKGLERIRHLRSMFAGRTVTKVYLALAHDPLGVWERRGHATLDTPLGFDPDALVTIRMGRGELECATHVHFEERYGERTLLRVRIEGGRQHQIRAHLSLEGTPIVGDKLYQLGDEFFTEWSKEPGRADLVPKLATRWHCLHAHAIEFPFDGDTVAAEAPLPPHFVDAMAERDSAF